MAKTVSKSFIYGFMRTLDLSGAHKWPDIHDSEFKDASALKEDWNYVGKAINASARKVGKQEGVSIKLKAKRK